MEAPSTQPSTRLPDTLWSLGLILGVLGLLVASFGGAGGPARAFGLLALLLALFAAVSLQRRTRKLGLGALLAGAVALFTIIVGGRPNDPAIIPLADAPKYVRPKGLEDEDRPVRLPTPVPAVAVGGQRAIASEPLTRPGPIALSAFGLKRLSPALLRVGELVTASWDGAWFAARILSLAGSSARVHFVGWESDWDADMPSAQLYAPSDGPIMGGGAALAAGAFGNSTPQPCALTAFVYQPAGGWVAGTAMSSLTPNATLYAMRLDLQAAPLATALPSIAAGKPFALGIEGAARFDSAGIYFFGLSSDGDARLSIDGAPVTSMSPVELSAGVHTLRLEYQHAGGPSMTLGLRVGSDPKALRVLDMTRYGVAQVAREPDGSLRIALPEGVLFDLDKDVLNASAERALTSIFTLALAPVPTAAIRVEGHTDDSGTDEHNLDLSDRRANRVRGWLLARGRTESTLTTQAFGEKRPRVPNDSESHRKMNRRVELVVSPTAAAPPVAAAPPAPSGSAASVATALALMQRYYKDLSAGQYDADRYFDTQVERFVTMTNTSPAAINHYMRDVFPKQYRDPRYELQAESFTAEEPGTFVYVVHSSYVFKGKATAKQVRVRIRLSPAGKLVFLHQFEVIK